MTVEIKVTAFPAENGESILIECNGKKKVNILVDLGFTGTYKKFIKEKLKLLVEKKEKIDLLVLTHYDADHIEGAISFLRDLQEDSFIDVDEIWVNDFLALSSSKIDISELSKGKDHIYDFSKFIASVYRSDSATVSSAEISIGQLATITKLINLLGYDSKINKSLVDKSVYVNSVRDDNLIKIGDEVNIQILSPQKNKLQELLYHFFKWFESDSNIYSNIDKNELYELFIANSDDNKLIETEESIIKRQISSNINCEAEIESILACEQIYSVNSLANKTSIAFSLNFKDYNILFTGDIDIESIVNEIDKKKYNLFKISHHGSKNNTNRELLNKVNCDNYLICTNGKGRSKHPDLETLVYIAQNGNLLNRESNIYMNYPIDEISISNDIIEYMKERFKLNIIYPNSDNEKVLELIFHKGAIKW